MGKNLVFLPECHSTNSEAAKLADQAFPDGSIVITANQTAGKGQRGSVWTVEPGKNLTFSLFLRPTFLAVREQFHLNRAVAVGILDYVESRVAQDVHIKWPNDILVDGFKVCGILIENSISGSSFAQSIVGIGMNVNQREFAYPKASSIANFHGEELMLDMELEDLLLSIEKRYLMLKAGNIDGIRQDYDRHLYWKGEKRLFKSDGHPFEGTLIGDNDQGRLIIELDTGLQTFGVKELEYVS